MLRHWSLPFLIIIFLILQLLLQHSAKAEYRVYRLGIKYDEKQKNEFEILTTLDDLQYVTYYKFTPIQKTRLIEHWMCPGRTDQFKKYCSRQILKPSKTKAPAQSPVAYGPTQANAQNTPPTQNVPLTQAPATPQQIMLQ